MATRHDAHAFGRFYERHERLVFGYFVTHTRNVEVSADLTAETFAAALASSRRFRPGPGPAVSWLIAIAHNKLVSSIRRGAVEQRAQRRLGIQDIALTDADLERIEAQIDSDRSPLEDLLAELPDDQRDAIRAHVLDEDTYDEISRRLGTSQAVVRKRVSRGLHQLRRQIEGD